MSYFILRFYLTKMGLRLFYCFTLFTIIKAFENYTVNDSISIIPDNVFNGVYSECFLHLSYSCLQRKTLLYLKELNNLSEVSVIGDYVKFVKINKSDIEEQEDTKPGDTEELAFRIDEAVDNFFDSHVLKFYALGRNITMPPNEAFVGRKRKGGGGGGGGGGHGGGGGGGGHGGGHDDGGKKKMMMMAMMCMKMKLMMMVPAMMGMMGMMSFKGMMFSMMSFMISKMMLLMKILEKKGGGGGLGGGGGGGGLDGGWPAGGAGGGAWMPAGGQDYAGGGGGGGGYDANGQWQSRSIVETLGQYKTIDYGPTLSLNKVVDNKKWLRDDKSLNDNNSNRRVWEGKEANPVAANNSLENDPWPNTPEISFVKPVVRYNNNVEKESRKNPVLVYKRSNVNFDFGGPENDIAQQGNDDAVKRLKRDIEPNNRESKYDKDNDRVNTRNMDDGYNINDNISLNSSAEDKSDNNKNDANIEIINEIKEPRQKRSIVDILQNSYIYWINKVLGINNNRRTNFQKYKIVNGIKYVYYPYRMQKPKMPKAIQPSVVQNEDLKPLVAVDDFNKGEIVEGGIESRMMKKKLNKMKDTVNDTMDDNPWE